MDRSPRLSARRARLVLAGCTTALLAACVAISSFALTLPSDAKGRTIQVQRSIAGVWTGRFTDPNGPEGKVGHSNVYLRLAQSGSQITGAVGPSEAEAAPIKTAQLDGNKLHLTTTVTHGDMSVDWTLDLTVHGNEMTGTGHGVRGDQHSWDITVDLARQQ